MIEIDIFYQYPKPGHKHTEKWEKTEYYCPTCGNKNVWHELDAEDYYVGENFMCSVCSACFTFQDGMNSSGEATPQRLKSIQDADNNRR